MGTILRALAVAAASVLAFGVASSAAFAAPISIGVNVGNGPGNPAALDQYTSAAGRAPAIVMWYQAWSEPLYYSSQMPDVLSRGATPMITWDPANGSGGIPLRDIASGAWDSYIDQSAEAARAVGQPIYIRFAHEMNLSSSPWGPGNGGNTASDFVAAWQHVVTRFRADGATNVQWVWSPNVYCGGSCPFTAFYPGDAYVDWVALDGYNYGPVDGVPWMSLSDIFGPSYDLLTGLTQKPVMIAETGSTESGGDKAAWIESAFLQELPTRMPRVRAVIWFDRVKETDWRVDSSAASAAAWQQVLDSPLYGGSGGGTPAPPPTPPAPAVAVSVPATPVSVPPAPTAKPPTVLTQLAHVVSPPTSHARARTSAARRRLLQKARRRRMRAHASARRRRRR